MLVVINGLLALSLIIAAATEIVFLRRNTLLAAALTASLFIVTSYAVLNVEAVERAVHEIVPSGSSILKDLLLVSSFSAFAVAAKALGGRWGVIGIVVWPVLVAAAKVASWLDVRQWCAEAGGLAFDECAKGSLPYTASEVLLLLSLTVYGAGLLRQMVPFASRKTAPGRAVLALSVGLVVILVWSVVAVWGAGEAYYLGHLSAPQKFLRTTLSIAAVLGLVVGMFIIPVSRAWQQAHLRRVAGPVRKRLDELAGADRARGVPLVTHLMDQIGIALHNEGEEVVCDASGGERQAALWLLGRGPAPAEVPMAADLERQANWLIRVATIMKNETRESN